MISEQDFVTLDQDTGAFTWEITDPEDIRLHTIEYYIAINNG